MGSPRRVDPIDNTLGRALAVATLATDQLDTIGEWLRTCGGSL